MSRSKPIFVIIVLLGLFAQASCSSTQPSSPSGLPVTSMQIGSKTYNLEIAADEPSREHGLMERESMAADHGMIFVFDVAVEQSFWMKHTRFPLDIVFADDHQKVVSIHMMKAYDESSTYSNGASKYAIEPSAGEAPANGVKPGDQLQIPSAVDAALKK